MSRRPVRLLFPLLLASLVGHLPATRADDVFPPSAGTAVFTRRAPESVADLKVMQARVREVLRKAIPCTVNVRAGMGQGSGVIVSADGYVLTAGHVSGPANRDVTVTLHDGRRVKGKTLGANRAIDSGLIKITDPGPWPHAEMGRSAGLAKGQWCITAGHPNGYVVGRAPVVRLGRVLDAGEELVRTDCTLVGGDSGGPLFDLDGRVVGIHSRIGMFLTANIHVPVDTYRDTWDLLVKGEVWSGPWVGFQGDRASKNCKVETVTKDSPADKAGLKPEDVITRFDGRPIETFEALKTVLDKKKPGDTVEMEVLRGEGVVTLRLVVAGRKPS